MLQIYNTIFSANGIQNYISNEKNHVVQILKLQNPLSRMHYATTQKYMTIHANENVLYHDKNAKHKQSLKRHNESKAFCLSSTKLTTIMYNLGLK